MAPTTKAWEKWSDLLKKVVSRGVSRSIDSRSLLLPTKGSITTIRV